MEKVREMEEEGAKGRKLENGKGLAPIEKNNN